MTKKIKKKITRVSEVIDDGVYSYWDIIYVFLAIIGTFILDFAVLLIIPFMLLIKLLTMRKEVYYIEEKL